MLRSMTSTDLLMWRDYYETMPDKTEHYLAQICYLICIAAGMKNKEGRQVRPSDFAPDLRTPAERALADARFAQAEMDFAAMRERAKAKLNGGGE